MLSGTPTVFGTFNFTITATDSNIATLTGSEACTLTVNSVPPTATLIAPTSVNEGTSFVVALTNSYDPSNPETTAGFHYAFVIDGASLAGVTYANASTSSSQNFTFTAGLSSHSVTVRILAADGDFTNYTASIQVNSVPPTATLVAPTTVNEGSVFTLALTNPVDPSVPATTAGFHYAFALAGASMAGVTYANASTNPSQSFAFADGLSSHIVTERILTNDGTFTNYTVTIQVNSVAPTATLVAPATVNAGSAFTVSLTNPFDPSNADTAAGFHYAFAVDGASLAGVTYATASTNPSQSLTLNNALVANSVTALIIASDGDSTEYTTPIQVNLGMSPATLPNAWVNSPYSDALSATGGSGSYSFAVSSGSLPSGLTLNPNTGAIGGTPTTTGTFSFTITATDTSVANLTGSQAYTMNINTISIGGPYAGLVGSAVSFAATVTGPGAPGTSGEFHYAWSFGDGGTSTQQSPSYTYVNAGTYTVTLTATDQAGGATTTTTTVPVYSTVILGDNGPGFSDTGPGWGGTSGGYLGELQYTGAAPGAASATWQASGLTPGTYALQATWNGSANHTSAAVYNIYDGNTLVQTVTVSQQQNPAGPVFGGVSFQTLADVPVDSGTVEVVLLSQAVGDLVANAIRVAPTASPPTATFSGPSVVNAGSTNAQVAFSNASGGTGGNTYSYDFNDSGTFEISGSSSPTAIIPASYLANGPSTLVVRGRITDNSGNFSDYTTSIVVAPPNPQATITGEPVSGQSQEGTPIALQGSVSNPAAGAQYSYAWHVTDNGVPFAIGSGAQFTFTPDDHNTYVITLTATDQSNNSSSATQTVTADIIPPTATLVAPATVNAGSAFTVALTNPVDPSSADTAAGFHYAFVLDGASLANATYASASTSAAQNFSFNDGPSNHTVTVRIIAADGGFTDYTSSIHVNYVPPTATIGGPYEGSAGSAITFLGGATDPSATDTAAGFQYSWSFGDGVTSTLQSPSHTYANVGTYTVTLTVTDTVGGTSTVSTTANVFAPGTYLAGASFVGVDTTTQGNWGNAYGGDGNAIADVYSQYPAYAQVSFSNAIGWLWAASTTDGRALTSSSNPSQRIAGIWYNPNGFTIDINLTDGQSHLVALYLLDWANSGLDERVDVLDAATGNVLNSQTVSGFSGGEYLDWNISGHVQIQVTNLDSSNLPNAVASGLFFGSPGHPSTPVVTPTTPVNAYVGVSRSYVLGSFSDAWVNDGPWTVTVNWGDSTTSTFTTTAPGALSDTHTYATTGTYTASVTVTNSNGLSASANTATIDVLATPNPGDDTAPFIVTPYLNIPNFGAFPTVFSAQSGAWSSSSTWSTGVVPSAGAVVSIEPGTTVSYDVDDTTDAAPLNTVIVQSGATLTFSTTTNTQMYVVNLMVLQGGTLDIGTQANPMPVNVTASVVWANQPINTNIDPEQYGNGLIVLGTMNTYGTVKAPYVTLAQNANAGDTVLHLASPATGWQVGDKLQLPDTRQLDSSDEGSSYTSEVESMTIASISADGLTITLTTPLLYSHLGGYNAAGVLEYLPQVLDMTRNVSIHSQSATGTRGYALFTGNANVNINYTSFMGMGRTTDNGIDNTTFNASGNVTHMGVNEANRNAITFLDLIGPSSPQADGYQFTFNGNVVTCPLTPMPFIWGINVVNSYYGLIQNNDVVNWAGAGVMVDNVSSFNNFTGNFVMRINGTGQRGSGDLGLAGDGFWFGNPDNYVTNNIVTDLVVTGPYGYGFEFYASNVFGVFLGLLNIPAYQGADPSQPGQSQSVNMNLMPLLAFANNEVYGVAPIGMSYWDINYDPNSGLPVLASGGTVRNFVTWNLWSTGIYGYQASSITVNGFVCLGNAAELAGGGSDAFGMQFQDYYVANMVIENADIEDQVVGILAPDTTNGTITIENSYLADQNGIVINSLWSVSYEANFVPARDLVIDNVQFVAPEAGQSFTAIAMDWYNAVQLGGVAPVTQLDQVFVYNYDGVSGDNFQVFYTQQAADFIVPQTVLNSDGTFRTMGAPVAGLTNAQAWAQYDVAIAGAVAPADATTMNNIVGLVAPI